MRKINGFMVGHRNGEYYLIMHGIDSETAKPWSKTIYKSADFTNFTENAWHHIIYKNMNQSNLLFITEYGSNDKVLAKKAYDRLVQNMNRNDEFNEVVFKAYERVNGGSF